MKYAIIELDITGIEDTYYNVKFYNSMQCYELSDVNDFIRKFSSDIKECFDERTFFTMIVEDLDNGKTIDDLIEYLKSNPVVVYKRGDECPYRYLGINGYDGIISYMGNSEPRHLKYKILGSKNFCLYQR